MAVPLPDAGTRWRCTRCGNLTRFDVHRTRSTVEYWHLDLSGEPTVAQTEVVAESVEQVRCRWCDVDGTVELVARPVDVSPPEQPAEPAGR
jgi:hypothetical protein